MVDNNRLKEIKSVFRHISISSFIKYFEVFEKEYEKSDNTTLYAAFDQDKELHNWTINSYRSRASKGKNIFRKNLQILALEYIVEKASESKVGVDTISKSKNLLQRFSSEQVEIEPEIINSIDKIWANDQLDEIEKNTLTKIRLGQSNFRNKLIEYWQKCSVCEIENEGLLIASHIKPYFHCESKEKYDLFNGLLLGPNLDKLFDRFLISFDHSGNIMISKSLSQSDLKKLGVNTCDRLSQLRFHDNHIKYLDFHNQTFAEEEKKRVTTE